MADHERLESEQPSLSVAHFVRTLRRYIPTILVAMAAVMIGYIIVAAAAYVLAPSQRVSSQSFRLEFKGAESGVYPSGMKFSGTEILSTDVLLRVFNQNDLSRFAAFGDFSRSIYVLESNPAYEKLASEFQARLSDPRLTAVDRERIIKEFELKRASLSKDEYSIHFLGQNSTARIPSALVPKILQDILQEWSRFAVNEQRVLDYPVAVLSADIINFSAADTADPVVQAQVLRTKGTRVLANIDELMVLPAANLARTQKDKLSLADIRMRLDDILRFRVDPLVLRLAGAGYNGPGTIRFLEAQLAYDQRQLESQLRRAEVAREALQMYTNNQTQAPVTGPANGGNGGSPTPSTAPAAPEQTVMPQLSETFLDRLMNLATSVVNTEYRRGLVEAYHEAAVEVVPLRQAVAYDTEVLDLVRKSPGGSTPPPAVQQEITAVQHEIRDLVVKVHEIYDFVSRNLHPATHVMTVTSPVITRVQRAVSVRQLALYGVLTLFIAFPIVIAGCLIHNRIREEETAEEPYAQPAVSS